MQNVHSEQNSDREFHRGWSKYHTHLANASLDEILDLTPASCLFFELIKTHCLTWHRITCNNRFAKHRCIVVKYSGMIDTYICEWYGGNTSCTLLGCKWNNNYIGISGMFRATNWYIWQRTWLEQFVSTAAAFGSRFSSSVFTATMRLTRSPRNSLETFSGTKQSKCS